MSSSQLIPTILNVYLFIVILSLLHYIYKLSCRLNKITSMVVVPDQNDNDIMGVTAIPPVIEPQPKNVSALFEEQPEFEMEYSIVTQLQVNDVETEDSIEINENEEIEEETHRLNNKTCVDYQTMENLIQGVNQPDLTDHDPTRIIKMDGDELLARYNQAENNSMKIIKQHLNTH